MKEIALNLKEIIVDSSLTAVEEIRFREYNPRQFFNIEKEFEPITTFEGEVVHRNYLDYLVICWKNHYGVVISPTILWNMVLANLAHEVNENPETYRKYFTDSDEKKEIIVTQNGNKISPTLLINTVKDYIPSDVMRHMFPDFTTDTEKSMITNYIAFLDMVSPYYNYGMLLCGIPKVKVLGTEEDWILFGDKCMEISQQIPEFGDYLSTVRSRIGTIITGSCEFSDMFTLDRCGSGGQVEVRGWITEMFIEQPQVNYPENFISCISKIDYKCYNENPVGDYRLYAGLFTSKVKNGYLVPAFDNIYFQKTREDVEPTLN